MWQRVRGAQPFARGIMLRSSTQCHRGARKALAQTSSSAAVACVNQNGCIFSQNHTKITSFFGCENAEKRPHNEKCARTPRLHWRLNMLQNLPRAHRHIIFFVRVEAASASGRSTMVPAGGAPADDDHPADAPADNAAPNGPLGGHYATQ